MEGNGTGTVMADPDLSTELCGITLPHPVINGSGTFDAIAARRAFGDQLLDEFTFSAFVSKTITPETRTGGSRVSSRSTCRGWRSCRSR